MVKKVAEKATKKIESVSKPKPEKMYVGVKAMIFRTRETGEREIFMLKAKSTALGLGKDGWRWDIPGGRIDKDEYQTEDTLRRELEEEIPGVKRIKMGKILGIELVWRESQKSRVALCYYEVLADLSGIKVGDEHLSYEWVPVKEVEKLRNGDGARPDWIHIFTKIR